MPWRLVFSLLLVALVVAFAGFNLGNSSDISFGFTVVEQVPIFISVLTAFIFGALFAVPFAMIKASKKRKLMPTRKPDESNNNRVARKRERLAKKQTPSNLDLPD